MTLAQHICTMAGDVVDEAEAVADGIDGIGWTTAHHYIYAACIAYGNNELLRRELAWHWHMERYGSRGIGIWSATAR